MSGTTSAAQSKDQVHQPLPGFPHFAPKAKALIYLHMNGGPSQIDLLDYKPTLNEFFDKDLPESVRQGQRITTMTSGQARLPVAPSMFKFNQHGKSGTWISELLPWTSKVADDLCVIRSLHAESNNHGPALFQMNSGFIQAGRPSMGSWVTYGLGSESENLPAFVVLMDHQGAPVNGALNWSNGFMPAAFQGVPFRSSSRCVGCP